MFRWRRKKNTREAWRKGEKLRRAGKTEAAEELLLQAAQSASALDKHYAYLKLIQLYQDMMAAGDKCRQDLVEICLKDIELFPDFYEAWLMEYSHRMPTPNFPSFSLLADIYESEGKIKEAIALCELAIGYNLQETKGENYPDRLERLYRKLEDK
ncbi:MAG: hypothetical protein ACOX4N_01285 [Dethiobacteraceae bacterium]|jgi:tetratricopeptide (TPR) repeat protein|nr:hypothetical protein [Bacillota bacterium]